MELMHSHIGLCVTDLDAALKFYRDGLGFRVVGESRVDSGEHLFELSEPHFTAIYVAHGNLVLELFQFEAPNDVPAGGVRPLNLPGLTHLCFEVDDIDDVRQRILKYDGTARDSTRYYASLAHLGFPAGCVDGFHVLMCTDPDGNRIELVKSAGSPIGELGERPCWQAAG